MTAGSFDRDTAVRRVDRGGTDGAAAPKIEFDADVSPDWRAGRGPHGGYLAAMLLRALTAAVADPLRAPRSLTIHYARAPRPGPVTIAVTIEREGRSLSTLSARMEQDGRLIALALAAFSVSWSAQEIAELSMPAVAPRDPERKSGTLLHKGAPPFIRLREPATTPTIDLTIHFRSPTPRSDPQELCFARFRSGLIHDGFFEEDGVIWAADGTVLAQSRQLGIVMALPSR